MLPMAGKVKPGGLEAAVSKALSEYFDGIKEATDEAVTKVAKSTVKEIRKNAKDQFPRGTGEYAKSWAQRKANGKDYKIKPTRVVYSKAPHYRLTHLLENGHAKVNGGRVPGRPHIAPAEQKAQQELEREIQSWIEGAST